MFNILGKDAVLVDTVKEKIEAGELNNEIEDFKKNFMFGLKVAYEMQLQEGRKDFEGVSKHDFNVVALLIGREAMKQLFSEEINALFAWM